MLFADFSKLGKIRIHTRRQSKTKRRKGKLNICFHVGKICTEWLSLETKNMKMVQK